MENIVDLACQPDCFSPPINNFDKEMNYAKQGFRIF